MQVKAIFLLELLELRSQNDDRDKRLREALLATGRFDFEDLFPEYASTEATTDEQIDAAMGINEAGEYDGVDYDFSEATFDPGEAERLMASLLGEHSSGTMTARQMINDGWQ